MSKLNISKGNWRVGVYGLETQVHTSLNVVATMECDTTTEDFENAKLIADAGNTYNKCGMLPSELLEELNKLKTK